MDDLGNRCKEFEMAEAGRKLMLGLPILARLDGRAFHTFTKGLARPYDKDFMGLMVKTASHLVEMEHADLGYTQSDEITLVWLPKDERPFGGRIQKLESILAGRASGFFSRHLLSMLPSKADLYPHFDCRVWAVPDLNEVYNVFKWRELDASKNSLSMLAQAHFSHKQLHGKKGKDQHDLLHSVEVNWNDEEPAFKRGTYLRRETVERILTLDELARIPKAHRPEGPVLRTMVKALHPHVAKMEPYEFLKDILGVPCPI
jgi:tRNA(His) 5'-end guanylyltransferase